MSAPPLQSVPILQTRSNPSSLHIQPWWFMIVPMCIWIISHWPSKICPASQRSSLFIPKGTTRPSFDTVTPSFALSIAPIISTANCLNKQDDIRDLAVTCAPILDLTFFEELPDIFPPTSLPHLAEISASLCFLRALVPGSPVHTVRFKSYHAQYSHWRWGLDDIVNHSTVPVRNLGLDLTIWPLSVLHERALLPKHVEEITLSGFSTGRPFTVWGPGINQWGTDVHLILASAPNLKRLTFWVEGEREDACQWAQLLFQEFYDKLSRLEQVSCVVTGPDMSTSFDFFEENMGYLPIGSHEDNRTRGHRAANDIRELMPVPVLCCWTEEILCHRKTNTTLQLDRRMMERWVEVRADNPRWRWPGSSIGETE